MKQKPILLDLYLTFFNIGLFTFGGGYAMLPLLINRVVETNRWAREDEILNYFAIGQCTPGIIAVNTATFIGYKMAGILGGILATIGFISPSVIMILLIANLLNAVVDLEIVGHAFAGIRIAVTALIASSVYKLFLSNAKGVLKAAMAVLAFVAIAFFKVSPILITVAAAVLGMLFFRGGEQHE